MGGARLLISFALHLAAIWYKIKKSKKVRFQDRRELDCGNGF